MNMNPQANNSYGGNGSYGGPPYMGDNSYTGKFGYRGSPQFAPMSAWSYFGYSLLFCIPLVGLIFLIVFSCSDKNINRRCFARSFWIPILLSVIVAIIFLVARAFS